jgi:hypothetical protein
MTTEKMPWEAPLSDEDQLNKRLGDSPDNYNYRNNSPRPPEMPQKGESPIASITQSGDFCQWSAGSNETFRPSGKRRETLPSGVYVVDADSMGPFFMRTKVVTDNLIELDDAATVRVLPSCRKFWNSKAEYVKRGVLYKRGLLLWGPAGSGKTATLALLMKDLLGKDGLVFICQNPALLSQMLAILRRIEPDRNLIVVLEDIDELVNRFGEHDMLALLDGETQIDNVVNIATTNYPERLGARIINRPSRFDERILIGMPNPQARWKYLRHITKSETMNDDTLRQWVKSTEGFSVAHLRELAVAVFCLDQPFEEVLERLSKMQYQPKALKEFSRQPIGISYGEVTGAQAAPATGTWIAK